ncbi:hypothetical protein DRJ22_04745 [Candidatus Woesearchaeota archaeon]|nr:MAG: hypothetical protein B6U93_02390 [Candidatus Woesearchaeota archaeon ex4484_78]RLE45285.1 MAG: hypothetical protein DRJ22_04745 [Candidatus Woesearchaeota archaeon]
MIIGSDFDGVIADETQAKINFIKERHNISIKPSETHRTALEKKLSAEILEDIKANFNSSKHTLDFVPFPGVAEVFRKLVSEGDKIIIVTGRGLEGLKWAREFMKIHKIPFHHMWSAKKFFLNVNRECERALRGWNIHFKSKGRLAEAVKLAVFVDDSERFLEELYPLRDKIKLFLFDQPYNRKFSMEGVERVYGWPEIYEKIQELKMILTGCKNGKTA